VIRHLAWYAEMPWWLMVLHAGLVIVTVTLGAWAQRRSRAVLVTGALFALIVAGIAAAWWASPHAEEVSKLPVMLALVAPPPSGAWLTMVCLRRLPEWSRVATAVFVGVAGALVGPWVLNCIMADCM
jgi:hypothetical protein